MVGAKLTDSVSEGLFSGKDQAAGKTGKRCPQMVFAWGRNPLPLILKTPPPLALKCSPLIAIYTMRMLDSCGMEGGFHTVRGRDHDWKSCMSTVVLE